MERTVIVDGNPVTVTHPDPTPAEAISPDDVAAAVVLATELLARQSSLASAVQAEDPQAAVAVVDDAVTAAVNP